MQSLDWMLKHLDIVSMILAVPVLAYVSFTDIREFRIPNKVMFPALAVALVVALARPERWWLLLGGLFVAVALLLPSIMAGKRQIGGGDVKLGLFIGLILGWPGGLWTAIVSCLLAMLFTIGGILMGRIKWRSKIAFGPFLSLGAVFVGAFAVLWQLGI